MLHQKEESAGGSLICSCNTASKLTRQTQQSGNLRLLGLVHAFPMNHSATHAQYVASTMDCFTHAVADKMATESGAHSDSGEDRVARLRGHAEYFSTMLNLIPAKYYFVEDDPSTKQGGKYIKHKKTESTVQRG